MTLSLARSSVDLLEQMVVDERALLQTARHGDLFLRPRTADAAAADDELLRRLLGLVAGATLGLAPRRHRGTTTGGLALATTERVVDRVHGDATGLGAHALPAVAAGLADLDQLVLGVADLTDGGPAVDRHPAHLGAGQAQAWRSRLPWRPAARSCRPSGPSCRRRPAAARRCARWCRPGCSAAAARCRADVGAVAALDRSPTCQTVRRQDVALLAVVVVQQGDAAGAVRVVLDGGDLGRHAVLGRA